MKIGAEQIDTPDENPLSYHLDWRNRVARATVGLGAKERKRLEKIRSQCVTGSVFVGNRLL